MKESDKIFKKLREKHGDKAVEEALFTEEKLIDEPKKSTNKEGKPSKKSFLQ